MRELTVAGLTVCLFVSPAAAQHTVPRDEGGHEKPFELNCLGAEGLQKDFDVLGIFTIDPLSVIKTLDVMKEEGRRRLDGGPVPHRGDRVRRDARRELTRA